MMRALAWSTGGLVVASALLTLAVAGFDADLQPSAQRVLAACVPGLLAVLFRPGTASPTTWQRLAGLMVAWASIVAAVAVATGLALAPEVGPRTVRPLLATAAFLFVLLLPALALATLLDALAAPPGVPYATREASSWSVTAIVASIAAAPLWLGPAAELALPERPRASEAVLASSPLTQLATTAGNDLLRNQWFYQRSNLASLPVAYPRPAPAAAASLCAFAVLLGLLVRRSGPRVAQRTGIDPFAPGDLHP
jgi:hypothetical protein